MDDLLGIGDFSARCGLSPKMLRSYADAGLLVPAAVDGSSGYRYYSTSQVERARVIGLLRRAGIPVADIAAFFRNPDTVELDRWERDIEAELAARGGALAQARAALALPEAPRKAISVTSKRGRPMIFNLVAGSATHQGMRDSNQDAALVADELFAVADGLGGLQDGEVASRMALQTLHEVFAAGRSGPGLVSACQRANQAVWRQATMDGQEPSMGTTLTALGIVAEGELDLVHVGDSRLYRYRDGHLDRLTDDHSITGDLIRAGDLTEEEAITHPQRHILTRALGVAPDVDVDTGEVSCQAGDRLMLCTDGLFKALTSQELEAGLASTADAQQVADELITAAVAHGAEDNITAVIVDIR